MSDFLYPPTVAKVKKLLRVETTADDEVIQDMIADIDAAITTYLGAPITVTRFTDVDRAVSERNYALVSSMRFPKYPVVIAAATYGDVTTAVPPVITDVDGTVVDPATYRVDSLTGLLTTLPDGIALTGAPLFFSNGPYARVYWAGFQCHPEYASRIDPLLRRAAIDWIADLYQRRSPAAKAESAGGGSSVTWDTASGIPSRICAMLGGLRHMGNV